MIYHETKQAAIDSGSSMLGFGCKASLEPYNGWVAILHPVDERCFDVAWSTLLDRFEIDALGLGRIKVPDLNKKKAPPPPEPASRRKPPVVAAEPEPEAKWNPGDPLPW
jgi:hypothetical protein